MTDNTVKLVGDDDKVYDVPAAIARKLIHTRTLAGTIIDVLDNGRCPDYLEQPMIDVSLIREQTAIRIANKLRSNKGKFQMAREAVADWIEEGGWK